MNSSGSPPNSPLRTVLVLGMHRSGTSALTSALAELGFELGAELLPPAADNPLGFFENARIVTAQDELLERLGTPWFDPRPLSNSWLDDPAARLAVEQVSAELAAMGSRSTLLAVKDPRSCRLLPLWFDVSSVAQTEILPILLIRRPREVMRSLSARDGIGPDHGSLLWLEYHFAAIDHELSLSAPVVQYDDLLAHPEACLRELLSRLNIDVQVDGRLRSIQPSMRHHQADPLNGSRSPIEQVADLLFGRLCGVRMVRDLDRAEVEELRAQYEGLRAAYLAGMSESALGSSATSRRFSSHLTGLGEADSGRESNAPGHAGPGTSRASAISTASAELAAEALLARSALGRAEDIAVRLYYRSHGEGFAEERAVDGSCVPRNGRALACFELTPAMSTDWIRVDLGHLPGVFTVHSVRIDDVSIDNLSDAVTSCNEHRLRDSAWGGIRISASGNDPWFELRMPAAAEKSNRRALRIEVDFAQEHVAKLLADEILRTLSESSPGMEARMDKVLSKIDSRADEHLRNLASAIRSHLDQLIAKQSAEKGMTFDSLRSEFDRLQNVVSAVVKQNSAVHDQIGALEGKIDSHCRATNKMLSSFAESAHAADKSRTESMAKIQEGLEMQIAALAKAMNELPEMMETAYERRALWRRLTRIGKREDGR